MSSFGKIAHAVYGACLLYTSGAGGHDPRHAAAGADEHGDEALARQTELAEHPVQDEGDAGHVAPVSYTHLRRAGYRARQNGTCIPSDHLAAILPQQICMKL